MGFNIFKKFKKEDTVIDLSNLQKRGILKGKKETLDLTNSSVNDSPLGFIGSLANSAESSETPEVSMDSEQVKLKGILRDMKGKVDNSYNKIYKLSDRIDLLEKKIDRLERRSGVGD